MGKSTIKNKRAEIMVIVISAVLVAVIFTMLIRFNKNKEFVYNKHLDETVISIDDENITLKEFSYYVYIVEKQVNDMAIKYNPDDTNEFWNTYFKNSLDSVFTRDYAKQLAKDLCEYDYIMEKETAVHNLYVTESEKDSLRTEAKDTYNDFTQKAKDNTQLSEDDIFNILCRRKLAEKYAIRAATGMRRKRVMSFPLRFRITKLNILCFPIQIWETPLQVTYTIHTKTGYRISDVFRQESFSL